MNIILLFLEGSVLRGQACLKLEGMFISFVSDYCKSHNVSSPFILADGTPR